MLILFFAHGGKEFLNEVLFAVLSYYQHHKANVNKLVIYTDNVAYFKETLPREITYVPVTSEQIKQWRGTIDFVHRIKIEILSDAFSRFPEQNILYLDSDIHFKENISFLQTKIENNIPIMSLKEGNIFKSKLRHFRKLASYLSSHQHIIALTPPIKVPLELYMYNAGIIGLSSNDKDIVDKALLITDFLYPYVHTHVTEQFAFSVLLFKKGTIYEAEQHIHHYWYFKEFREIINTFLQVNQGKSFEELVTLSTNINPEYMGSEKWTYKHKSFFQKLLQRITTGRKWKIKK